VTQDEQMTSRGLAKTSIQDAISAISRLVADERSVFTKLYQHRLRRALDHLLIARDDLE
jgi:hypothetical protein